MQLDVILPTYNRHNLLRLALDSLLAAELPAQLSVSITVVDNNSSDNTAAVVDSYKSKFSGRLHYILEKRQGRSSALNAGIVATTGDLVGMIDDDEQVGRSWLVRVYEIFSQSDVDFIGGPFLPHWVSPPPSWLPGSHAGVIGVSNSYSQQPFFYGTNEAEPTGGNLILKRSLLERVGLYSTQLGRRGERELADEDTDMFLRLSEAGARGMFIPDLVVYHYIHPERLTKRYFRRWHFWRGVSSGVLDRTRPKPAAYLFGIPRYLFGAAMRACLAIPLGTIRSRTNSSQTFSDELKVWDLAGFFYGKHFYRAQD